MFQHNNGYFFYFPKGIAPSFAIALKQKANKKFSLPFARKSRCDAITNDSAP